MHTPKHVSAHWLGLPTHHSSSLPVKLSPALLLSSTHSVSEDCRIAVFCWSPDDSDPTLLAPHPWCASLWSVHVSRSPSVTPFPIFDSSATTEFVFFLKPWTHPVCSTHNSVLDSLLPPPCRYLSPAASLLFCPQPVVSAGRNSCTLFSCALYFSAESISKCP